MAESSITEGLKEKLTCPLCHKLYRNPKLLPCLHSFCFQCLKEMQRRTRLFEQLRCPLCKYALEFEDVVAIKALPAPFYITCLQSVLDFGQEELAITCNSCDKHIEATSYCFNCKCLVCNECIQVHNIMKATRNHRIMELRDIHSNDLREIVQGLDHCSKRSHESEELVSFCDDCGKCICDKCKATEHNDHRVCDIKDAKLKCEEEINEGLTQLEVKARSLLDVIQTTESSYNNSVRKIVAVRKSVRDSVNEIIRVLRNHEKKMISELEQIQLDLRQTILSKKTEFEIHLWQARKTKNSVGDVLDRGIGVELLNLQHSITKRFKELLDVPTENVVDRRVNIDYTNNDDIISFLDSSEIGRLNVSYTDPSHSEVKSENVKEALTGIGERLFFEVLTKDSDGNPSYSEHDRIKVHIESEKGTVIHSRIEDNKEGGYNVAYTPLKTGVYDINVKVRDEPVRGSPFKVYVTTRAEYLQASTLSLRMSTSLEECEVVISLGYLEHGGSPFRRPCGIAVNDSDVIAIADSWNHQVQVLGIEGGALRILEKDGDNSNSTMSNPIGVAFDNDDNILVTDCDKHRVQVFGSSGVCIRTFGGQQLESPWGICTCHDGTILVCDWGARSTKRFSSRGKFLYEFKSPDMNPSGEPPRPYYVTERRTKYFVSFDNHSVQVFNQEGYFLYKIGDKGHGEGRFKDPRGIAIDSQDRLIVCDSGNHRIQVFSVDGKIISFGTHGTSTGEFDKPQDVAVTLDGRIIVTDFYNNRVQILKC